VLRTPLAPLRSAEGYNFGKGRPARAAHVTSSLWRETCTALQSATASQLYRVKAEGAPPTVGTRACSWSAVANNKQGATATRLGNFFFELRAGQKLLNRVNLLNLSGKSGVTTMAPRPDSFGGAPSCKQQKGCQAQHQVEGRLLLDVAVLELLAGEDQYLVVGRDALVVLDLLLHVLDRVRRLYVEGDGLAREGLDEDLRAAALTLWIL